MSSGWKRLKEARESGGSGRPRFEGPYIEELRIQEGQPRKLWFIGPPEEPHVRLGHTLSLGGRFPVKTCSGDEAAYPNQHPCVYCWAAESDDPRAKKPSERGAFSVFDATYEHRVQLKDKKTGKGVLSRKDKTPFMVGEACTGRTCPLCKKGVEKERAGLRVWDLAGMFASVLMGQVEALAQSCAACWQGNGDADSGTGSIERVGWSCSSCDAPLRLALDLEDPSVMACPKCHAEAVPKEALVCSNGCEGARRVVMQDGPWTITRTGSEKKTAYTPVFGGVQEPPDYVLAVEPLDLHARFWPDTVKRSCEELGLKQSPFAKAGARPGSSESYDEPGAETPPEEEEGEDPFADPPPPRGRPGVEGMRPGTTRSVAPAQRAAPRGPTVGRR